MSSHQLKCGVPAKIEWIVRKDMPVVLDIEQNSFEYPWSEQDIINTLRQRNTIGLVLHLEGGTTGYHGGLLGYLFYELHHRCLRILNMATHPDYRRLGVARAMVDKLIGKLSYDRRSALIAEVRDSNLPAQLLLREMGFRATGVIRNFYEATDEDAYAFQYDVGMPYQHKDVHALEQIASG